MTHTMMCTALGLFGVFFLAALFLKINIHFFSICSYNENRFFNASNIHISLMHTHSKKAEVCTATGLGSRRWPGLTAIDYSLAGSWPLATTHRVPGRELGVIG